LVIST